MHEVGIASNILELSQAEATRRPGSKLIRVGVRVGVLSGVDNDALQFAIEALTRGTDLETMKFEIETCPRRNRCQSCGHEFESSIYEAACPQCSSENSVLIGGDELDLRCVELEEA